MMAALQAFVTAHPVLAVILIAILVVMAMLLAASAAALRQLPPDTLNEVSEHQALDPQHTSGNASRPLPWNRGGGNWWPIP